MNRTDKQRTHPYEEEAPGNNIIRAVDKLIVD